jgi:hypothetical protein
MRKVVPGFEHYEASDCGQVRSIDRDVPHWRGGTARSKGRVLSPILHRGYHVVHLSQSGKIVTLGVHQVVAIAFHGEPPAGLVVNHKNGVKTDNRPDNLEYVTSTGVAL